MSEVIRFSCELPPVALRRNRETTRHGYRSKLIREYQEQVWCAGMATQERYDHCGHTFSLRRFDKPMDAGTGYPWPRAHLRLVWRHHRVGPDVDNALASCKWMIDVLKATGPRPLGIIQDDGPDNLTVELRAEKVKTKAEEGISIEIEKR